jgi:formate dehydrogenase maturation protein FdhE
MADMKDPWLDGLLFVLASPILLAQALKRAFERYRFFRLAMEAAIVCECGSTVSLVGIWRCSCGFTYRGHLLRPCPVCRTIPCVVRCYRCGVTTKLPEAS